MFMVFNFLEAARLPRGTCQLVTSSKASLLCRNVYVVIICGDTPTSLSAEIQGAPEVLVLFLLSVPPCWIMTSEYETEISHNSSMALFSYDTFTVAFSYFDFLSIKALANDKPTKCKTVFFFNSIF